MKTRTFITNLLNSFVILSDSPVMQNRPACPKAGLFIMLQAGLMYHQIAVPSSQTYYIL